MQNQNEKAGVGEGINEFIQRNRKPILGLVVTLVLLFVASVITLSLMDVFRGKANAAVEDLSVRYEALRPSIHEEPAFLDDDAEEHSHPDVEELLADIESFAQKTSGYAGGKAWSIVGNIRTERKEWAEAETAWAKAAGKAAKTYLAPIAWFKAGVAAEQQEKTEQAIEYYAKSVAAPAGFPSAARAQFSIGRLHEALGETDKAIDAYRAVITGWPNDGVWTDFARTEIIKLEL